MKNAVVVDASIAVKWVLNEEDSSTALALLKRWIDREVTMIVPTLLIYEVTNVFYQRVQSGKLPFDDANNGLRDVIFAVRVFDSPQDSAISTRAMELAHQFGLPATYDAHYLALAEREECELWTADTRMWRAIKGKLQWVRWLSDYQQQ